MPLLPYDYLHLVNCTVVVIISDILCTSLASQFFYSHHHSTARCSNCTTLQSWFCSPSRRPFSTAPSPMQQTLRRLPSYLRLPRFGFSVFVLEGKAHRFRLQLINNQITVLIGYCDYHPVAKLPKIGS